MSLGFFSPHHRVLSKQWRCRCLSLSSSHEVFVTVTKPTLSVMFRPSLSVQPSRTLVKMARPHSVYGCWQRLFRTCRLALARCRPAPPDKGQTVGGLIVCLWRGEKRECQLRCWTCKHILQARSPVRGERDLLRSDNLCFKTGGTKAHDFIVILILPIFFYKAIHLAFPAKNIHSKNNPSLLCNLQFFEKKNQYKITILCRGCLVVFFWFLYSSFCTATPTV